MENNNRQGCRWTNGRKKELLPPIDNDDFPKKYVVRVYGDDPHSGCVYCGMETAEKMRDINEDGYWEWLDESIEPCATSSECNLFSLDISNLELSFAVFNQKGVMLNLVAEDFFRDIKNENISFRIQNIAHYDHKKMFDEAIFYIRKFLEYKIPFTVSRNSMFLDVFRKVTPPLYEKLKYHSQTPSPTGDRDCEELKKEVERLKGLIGIDWKEEYDQAVNEIGQLQDQLKEAENEIRELNRNL